MCVCAGERQRESEEGDVGRVGQTRDVGWVRGFTWAHAANVSAVPNAVQQSGAQALSGGEPARSGVESAVRRYGLWVAGAGGLGPLPGGGAARGTADRSPSPDSTADKSPSRHVDGTLSTFTVLLKVATFTELAVRGRHLTQYQIIDQVCADVHITVNIMLPLDPTSLCAADVHTRHCVLCCWYWKLAAPDAVLIDIHVLVWV